MFVEAKKGYYDAEKGKVKAGDKWETSDARGKELIRMSLASEAEEQKDDAHAWARGMKKAELQEVYKNELGKDAASALTMPELVEAINAKRAENE